MTGRCEQEHTHTTEASHAGTDSRPLVLIDVDGPLNAFGGPYSGGQAPDGYVQHRLKQRSFTDSLGRAWEHGGLRIWLNPAHGPMLLTLAEWCELTWCTAWHEDANTYIGPAIGLPTLPVIELSGLDVPLHGIWKRRDVETYATGRALAWFDDDFEPADTDWAAQRTAAGLPTLIVPVDPAIGIVQADVDTVADWARATALTSAVKP